MPEKTKETVGGAIPKLGQTKKKRGQPNSGGPSPRQGSEKSKRRSWKKTRTLDTATSIAKRLNGFSVKEISTGTMKKKMEGGKRRKD